tara:strand:- start:1202 stop:1363 length:162 start_codon:yes stop_codon:yes gene_type:complete
MKKRQYRPNQGRSPKQVETSYKVIAFIFKVAIVVIILASIISILTYERAPWLN